MMAKVVASILTAGTSSQGGNTMRREAEAFVEALKNFHASLPEAQRAMLMDILKAAQQDDQGDDWQRLSEWLSKEREDETSGYQAKYKF
jgi:hypothetical protein